MVARLLILAPELVLTLAVTTALLSLLITGPAAGRAARYAVIVGTGAALAAAILTRGAADAFLFAAYRIDPLSQLIKAVICLGSLLAVLSSRDRWAEMRITSPFFHLCATMALVMCASIVNLLALPLASWIGVAGTILVAATIGRWSVLEKTVRRALGSWLGMFALSLVGAIVLAAAGGVRVDHLVMVQGEPPVVMRTGLLLWSAGALWMLSVGPLQLRRIEDDPSGSGVATALAFTSLAAVGGLVLLRAASLALPGVPPLILSLSLLLFVAPGFAIAARRFARSFRHPSAAVGAAAAVVVALVVIWPWITLAVAELD